MMRKYREKIYKCGDYLEVDIYPVFKKANARRKTKYKPTSAMQSRLNQRNAERALTRLLNANFTENDISLTLTYCDDCLPKTYEEAERDVMNFLRRLKRLRKKLNLPELKYVLVPGSGRYHFHIPMSGGVGEKDLQKLWGLGYANTIHFEFDKNGIEGHAVYIASQFEVDQYNGEDLLSVLDINEQTGEVNEIATARKKGQRRYRCSKNIIRPTAEHKDGRISANKVEEIASFDLESKKVFEKLYEGYCLSECVPYYNHENGGYYLTIKLYKAESLFVKKKRGRYARYGSKC